MTFYKSAKEPYQRKSPRAKHHHYGWSATYLITIITKEREPFFTIPTLRTIAETTWWALPERFPGLTLDEFVIMSDHIHFIIHLECNVVQPTTLGRVIGAYKSLVVHQWFHHLKTTGSSSIYSSSIWQRNYHDQIIYNQQELEQKRLYVRNNPLKLLGDLKI